MTADPDTRVSLEDPPGFEEEERDDAVIGRAMRWSAAGLLLLIVVAGGVIWWARRTPPVRTVPQQAVALPHVRTGSLLTLPEIPFTDITSSAGVAFKFENGAAGEKLLPETMVGGCAFFDYDSDGDPDLLLVGGSNRLGETGSGNEPVAADNRRSSVGLFANDGSGQFRDVTAEAGLELFGFYGMGPAVGDFDNDGDSDLYLSAVGTNRLFRNDGGRFVDVTLAAGVAGGANEWGASCGWLDYDRDGDLDLYVSNYVEWSREFDLAQRFVLTGDKRAYGRPQVFGGTFPDLYRNDGDGRFTDVSEQAGMHVRNPATGVPVAKSLGVSFADFDEDGWLDIFTANDTVQDYLFRNQHNGTFEEIGRLAGVAFDLGGNARGGMGTDVAAFRGGDDVLGVAVGNFANEMTGLYVSQPGALLFSDEAVSNGLGPRTRLQLTFGTLFFDADLDGRLDLFAANGHLEEEISLVQQSQTYAQSPQLFWNAGADSADEFIELGEEHLGTDFVTPIVGRGAAYADIDVDGDLDLCIATVRGPARLLRNDQQLGHHWLRIRLRGTTDNTAAIGSRIRITLPDGSQQSRLISPTRSYLSQVERTATFGLGNADAVTDVQIVWPSGDVQNVGPLEVDREHAIEQRTTARQ